MTNAVNTWSNAVARSKASNADPDSFNEGLETLNRAYASNYQRWDDAHESKSNFED